MGRQTNYFWNNFTSLLFDVNVGVGQGSMLSFILLALYLLLFLYILEKRLKHLKIPVSFISFINDSLFISQSKLLHISNCYLFCSYNVITILLEKFGLIVEHSKTKVFHFNRSQGSFNPPPLNLSPIGETILWPKNIWKYLGFIFDRKLFFHQHVDFYSNKAMSTVKCMKILSNSNQGINLTQKCLLYRTCVLSIVLYGFQLWFYNHTPMSYYLKILGKMQRRAAIWILGAFKTSPLFSIKAIARLIPIKLYFQKLGGRSQLQVYLLPSNHLIQLLIDLSQSVSTLQHSASLNSLTNCQCSLIKSHFVDMVNRCNGIFPSFTPLHSEFSPGHKIINNFSDQFLFNLHNKQKDNKIHTQQLDNMVIESSNSSSTAIVVTDASIKNDIATSILHIHTHNNTHNNPITKTIHYAVHVTSTEAELFAIRCSINQAQIVMAFPRSLLSLILSMWPKTSTLLCISPKFTLWLYSVNFENFSYDIKTIPLNFGNVPATLISLSIKQLTKIQRPSILFHYCLAKHHGTLARKAKVMIYWTFGKWHSKLQTSKENNSLIYLMTITTSLNHLMPKEGLGSKSLVTWTLCVCMLWEH